VRLDHISEVEAKNCTFCSWRSTFSLHSVYCTFRESLSVKNVFCQLARTISGVKDADKLLKSLIFDNANGKNVFCNAISNCFCYVFVSFGFFCHKAQSVKMMI